MTTLAEHIRGDTFVYSFTLGGGWVGADFSGGVKFTLREQLPDSSIVDDTDAMAQASVATGEIVFAGAVGTITIPAGATRLWQTGSIHWDLQGVVVGAPGSPDLVFTIDSGRLPIRPDVTRSA